MPETKRMLITGAGRGIGRAIAERLAQPGRIIILHGRDRGALEETALLVKQKNGEAEVVIADISTFDGIDKIVSRVGDGPLHALIHNAGVAYVEPLDKITLEHWESTLAVNITAPFLLTQKLLAVMPSGAAIVNILSVAATTVFPNWTSYCMSKFALDGFSRALREELRPRGFRVMGSRAGPMVEGEYARPGRGGRSRRVRSGSAVRCFDRQHPPRRPRRESVGRAVYSIIVIRSILLAIMKSLIDRPPIACVQSEALTFL